MSSIETCFYSSSPCSYVVNPVRLKTTKSINSSQLWANCRTQLKHWLCKESNTRKPSDIYSKKSNYSHCSSKTKDLSWSNNSSHSLSEIAQVHMLPVYSSRVIAMEVMVITWTSSIFFRHKKTKCMSQLIPIRSELIRWQAKEQRRTITFDNY